MEKENSKYKLPEGWIWTTVGEIGVVVSGGTPSTRNPEFWGDEIPWLTPADLSNYKERYISKGTRSITKVGLDYSSAKLVPKGSILFSSRAPIGYVAIAKNEISTNQGFKNLIVTKSISSEYIYYYFKTIKPLAEKMASGTTFLELSGTKFSQIPFPLPSFKEQHRIVSKIEELFSELDNAEEGLKKAQKQLEVYRQALLKSAFKGKLRIKTKGRWRKQYIGDIYSFRGGGTPSKNRPYYWDGDIKWASVKDIKKMYLSNTIDRITLEGVNNSSAQLAVKNDVILVTRISPGKVTIALTDVAINQDLKIVRPINDNVDYRFTYYLFRYLEEKISNLSKGTTVKGIRLNELNSIGIELPNIEIQRKIVLELESQNSLIDNLEQSINIGFNKLNSFRHATLKKAYEGKLILQDSSDEAASILLNRIMKEKELYLEEQNLKKRKTDSMKSKTIMKKSLIVILKENYINKEFTFNDIRSVSHKPYDDLKADLYKLLDADKEIEMVFNKKLEKLFYKIKS